MLDRCVYTAIMCVYMIEQWFLAVTNINTLVGGVE